MGRDGIEPSTSGLKEAARAHSRFTSARNRMIPLVAKNVLHVGKLGISSGSANLVQIHRDARVPN
jgi:hypothetical protein